MLNFTKILFPTKEVKFKCINSQIETLDRLNRRTEKSENLSSQFTDKSFIGSIEANKFKLISSKIGKGAFCIMTGIINSNDIIVKVEIHKVFRILCGIILLLPLIGLIITLFTRIEKFSPIMIFVVIGQILLIRYLFIGIAFKFLSRESLQKLREVLDLE